MILFEVPPLSRNQLCKRNSISNDRLQAICWDSNVHGVRLWILRSEMRLIPAGTLQTIFLWKYLDELLAVFLTKALYSTETFTCELYCIVFVLMIWPVHEHYVYKNQLKGRYTFGNCQRPVFSLGVSQHKHKITNLWKFGLN